MDNYLEKTCRNLGIKLIYTSNKITVLSAEKKDNFTVIRAHKLFKNCPFSVAEAIISYYTNETYKEKSKKVLIDYVSPHFPEVAFKIKPLEHSLKTDATQSTPFPIESGSNLDLLTEFTISSMTIKNLWGDEQNQSDNLLSPSSSDILDLNIIVKPPVT